MSGSLSYLYIDDRIVCKTYNMLARVHVCACVYTSKIKVNFIICLGPKTVFETLDEVGLRRTEVTETMQ